jgi:hypothetical protein
VVRALICRRRLRSDPVRYRGLVAGQAHACHCDGYRVWAPYPREVRDQIQVPAIACLLVIHPRPGAMESKPLIG